MSYRSNSNKGLTLAEVLLIMTLILITTALMAGVVNEYSAILRFGAGKTRSLEALQNGLIKTAAEVTQAARVTTPTPSSSDPSTTLIFERLNPSQSVADGRLPDPDLTAPPTSWNPVDSTHLVSVEYSLSDTNWLRLSGGEQQTVATGVAGFSATNAEQGSLLLSVSIQESRRIQTLSTHVYIPSRFEP